nr:hypothetical protein [Kingella kingae]
MGTYIVDFICTQPKLTY